MEMLLYASLALEAAIIVLLIVLLARKGKGSDEGFLRMSQEVQDRLSSSLDSFRSSLETRFQTLDSRLSDLSLSLRSSIDAMAASEKKQMELFFTQTHELNEKLTATSRDSAESMRKSIDAMRGENAATMQNVLKETAALIEKVRAGMDQIRTDNNKQLDLIRGTVDEKLQKTLETRISASFQEVTKNLESLYKSIGEMNSMAKDVENLNRMFSNVKVRGTWGEIQAESILSDILTPQQYVKNYAPGRSGARVEFAIRLPGKERGSEVFLPIDSKFPTDAYGELVDAYEAGDPARIKGAQDSLVARIRGFARDIRDKYINPPYTTEFAIMFLPTEGLYAEAVRLGLVERLQRECQVNLAGPSTMAALLNSLQMGFRTVAIQKRSGEVWKVLGAVKTEFDRFHEVLTRAQKQLTRANNELDTLIGVRTRRIQSRLKDVTAMPAAQVPLYLPEDAVEIMDTDDEEKEE